MFCLILGFINEERLRELLTSMGDRFTDDEVLNIVYYLSGTV